MKENIKELWVTALRSGEYEQTTEALQDEGGYCCLGVLCVVAEKNGVKLSVVREDEFLEVIYGAELSDQTEVEKWSDVTETQVLIDMNDEYEQSFDEIADYIDQNWAEL